MAKITVEKTIISVIQVDEEDFISLTDIETLEIKWT
jgi:hypothetical protein